MEKVQSLNQYQLQRKDIVDLFYWVNHVYGINIKSILLNYHTESWFQVLSGISRVEVVNGFRKLMDLRKEVLSQHTLFFPISAVNFLTLCRTA